MSISSIGSTNVAAYAQVTARTPESAETKGAPDHDGDADDGGVQAAAAARPSVNTQGQLVGSLIGVKA
jgi:hypothetical protein